MWRSTFVEVVVPIAVSAAPKLKLHGPLYWLAFGPETFRLAG
jgi:hypothetical protein